MPGAIAAMRGMAFRLRAVRRDRRKDAMTSQHRRPATFAASRRVPAQEILASLRIPYQWNIALPAKAMTTHKPKAQGSP